MHTYICLYACIYVSKIINVIAVSFPVFTITFHWTLAEFSLADSRYFIHGEQREKSVKPSCYLCFRLPARPCSRNNVFTCSGSVAEGVRLESGRSIGLQLDGVTPGSWFDWCSNIASKFYSVHHYQSTVGYIDSSLNYPFM